MRKRKTRRFPPLPFVTSKLARITYAPWGRHAWLSDPELTGTGSLLVVRVHMPPGRGHQFHAHPEQDEIIYVVDGVADQWVDREKRRLRSGEVAYIPKGVVHATHNPTKRPLTFLAVLSPASSTGPAVVDHFNDSPWRDLRKPIIHPGVNSKTGRRLARSGVARAPRGPRRRARR
jgi:quercetin dioxygenase-like cupin family protein